MLLLNCENASTEMVALVVGGICSRNYILFAEQLLCHFHHLHSKVLRMHDSKQNVCAIALCIECVCVWMPEFRSIWMAQEWGSAFCAIVAVEPLAAAGRTTACCSACISELWLLNAYCACVCVALGSSRIELSANWGAWECVYAKSIIFVALICLKCIKYFIFHSTKIIVGRPTHALRSLHEAKVEISNANCSKVDMHKKQDPKHSPRLYHFLDQTQPFHIAPIPRSRAINHQLWVIVHQFTKC